MISQKTRFEVLTRCNFRCVYCGTDSKRARLEIDHVVSRADGGSDEASNLAAACVACNNGKSARSILTSDIEMQTREAILARWIAETREDWGIPPHLGPAESRPRCGHSGQCQAAPLFDCHGSCCSGEYAVCAEHVHLQWMFEAFDSGSLKALSDLEVRVLERWELEFTSSDGEGPT